MCEKRVVLAAFLTRITLPRARCPFSMSRAVNHLAVICFPAVIGSAIPMSWSRRGSIQFVAGCELCPASIVSEEVSSFDSRDSCRDQASYAAGDHGQRRADKPRCHARFQFAELRPAHEEYHVH